MANEESKRKSKIERINEQRLRMRLEFWPEVQEADLWHRKRSDGFISVPRAMPLILEILDEQSSGKPLSKTYLALWFRTFDQSTVTIQSSAELAFESGFSGERAISTWISRMRILEELGFIRSKAGPSGEFQHILILNPLLAVKRLRQKEKVSEVRWTAIFMRCQQVGAKDLEARLETSASAARSASKEKKQKPRRAKSTASPFPANSPAEARS